MLVPHCNDALFSLKQPLGFINHLFHEMVTQLPPSWVTADTCKRNCKWACLECRAKECSFGGDPLHCSTCLK